MTVEFGISGHLLHSIEHMFDRLRKMYAEAGAAGVGAWGATTVVLLFEGREP